MNYPDIFRRMHEEAPLEGGNIYSSDVTMKGKVDKTIVLLSATARIIRPSKLINPALMISCRTAKDPGKLISLFNDPLYGEGSSESIDDLQAKPIKGQEEPIKPWQDVNQVRQLITDVLVAQGVV